jgi:hypothetical protein
MARYIPLWNGINDKYEFVLFIVAGYSSNLNSGKEKDHDGQNPL